MQICPISFFIHFLGTVTVLLIFSSCAMGHARFPLFWMSQTSTIFMSIKFSRFLSRYSSPLRITNDTLALTPTHQMIKRQWTVAEWRNASYTTFITLHFWCLVWTSYLDNACCESRHRFFDFCLPVTLGWLEGEPEEPSRPVRRDLAVVPLPWEVFLVCVGFPQHSPFTLCPATRWPLRASSLNV